MKKRIYKIVSLILAAALLFVPAADVQAANSSAVHEKYVMAFFSALKCRMPIRLFYTDETVFIAAEDLAAAAKMKGEGTSVTEIKTSSGTHTRDNILFTREGSVFSEEIKVKDCLVYQNKWYVPLQSTAKKLHVRYMYDEENRTLVFQHTEKLEEDLIDFAKFILGENEASHGVQRFCLENMVGMEESVVASVFNILTEKGIFAGIASLITGSYGKEKYSAAIASILNSEDVISISKDVEKELKNLDDGIDLYVNIVNTADELTVSFENDVEAMGENLFSQFGEYALTFGFRMSDTDQILKAFHKLKYFGPADFMALYHRMTLKEQSSMLYIRAFNYGLAAETEYISEKELISAIDDVYPFTKDGETESGDILSWIILRTAEKWADELAKDAAKEVQKSLIQEMTYSVMGETNVTLEGIITGIASKALLKFSKTKKRTDAVEQAYLLSQIQYYAAAAMRGHSYKNTSDYDPVAVKYALILYLRAAQAAYENFEFENDIKYYVDQAERSLKDLIIKVASWQDEQIDVSDDAYPELDMTKEGFFDSMEEQAVMTRQEQTFADSVTMMACGYMFSQGGHFRAYKFDWDHNGVSDLMISKRDDTAVLCAVSGVDPCKNQTYLISTGPDSQVFQMTDENGVRDMVVIYRNELGDVCYAPFTGHLERPVIAEVPASEMTDYQHFWSVNECLYTDNEYYEKHFDTLLQSVYSNYIDGTFYSQDSELPASEIERFAAYFSAVSGVKQTQLADINNDGIRDLAIRFGFIMPEVIIDGENAENDADILQMYGYDPFGLQDAGALLMSTEEGKIRVIIFSWDEILEMIGSASAGSGKALTDGVHQVVIYKSQVQGNAENGYTVTAYELEHVTYEDSAVRSLKIGDRIGDVVISQMDWFGDSFLNINNYELMLSRLGDGLWYQVLENDILVSVETDPFTLYIPGGTEFISYLNDPWTPEAVPDLETLLSYGYDDKEELELWVEQGTITQIIRQYRP